MMPRRCDSSTQTRETFLTILSFLACPGNRLKLRLLSTVTAAPDLVTQPCKQAAAERCRALQRHQQASAIVPCRMCGASCTLFELCRSIGTIRLRCAVDRFSPLFLNKSGADFHKQPRDTTRASVPQDCKFRTSREDPRPLDFTCHPFRWPFFFFVLFCNIITVRAILAWRSSRRSRCRRLKFRSARRPHF